MKFIPINTKYLKTSSKLTIKEFYEKRNKVLIRRSSQGVGDIFMHRMAFEDFHRVMPDIDLHFACLKNYKEIVEDHPYVDELLDANKIDEDYYIISYDTTDICMRTEMKLAPNSGPNRSDIWANHCGVEIINHNMHLNIPKEIIEFGRNKVKEINKKNHPSVLLAVKAVTGGKDLLDFQIKGIVDNLKNLGNFIYTTHTKNLQIFEELQVPQLTGFSLKEWMGIVNAADYIISVDTSVFHLAGGLRKPLVGIFGYTDGKVYGRYYDFILVQKHRDDDKNWTCGPCYNCLLCPKVDSNTWPKPCITEITVDMLNEGINKMFKKWQI